jgi:hypothetical protein
MCGFSDQGRKFRELLSVTGVCDNDCVPNVLWPVTMAQEAPRKGCNVKKYPNQRRFSARGKTDAVEPYFFWGAESLGISARTLQNPPRSVIVRTLLAAFSRSGILLL